MRKWTLYVLAACLAVGIPSAAALGDVVTDWNSTHLDAIRTNSVNPPVATRGMAMLHTAIFDAVNGLDRQYEPYLVDEMGPAGASVEAAAAAAAHRVLRSLYPNLAGTFQAQLDSHLAAIPDGQAKTDGIAWGQEVADAILALRSDDGSKDVVTYRPPIGSNWWVPTPPAFAPALLPNWPYVTPWTMSSGSQFRAPGPPLLTDDAYVASYNEVQALGRYNSTQRTADQSEIAVFWDDGLGTQTPPGHWNDIAQIAAAQMGNSLIENLRLFALLGLTVADAAIVSWDSKYHYGHWRPYTGIVMGDIDGNPVTARDTGYRSFITTPPFPSHTSGHSTFSGSSGRLLANFFGTDDIAFTVGSDGTPGVTRDFESLSEASEEAGQSRIYGGIHWQYENRGGIASRRALADYVFWNFLRPIDEGQELCAATGTRLCLAGGRFAVEIDWRAPRR